MKTDFIIFYEHISRELEGCQNLATELSSRGLSGYVLPIHYYRRIRVALLRPRIIIVPFLYNQRNSTHLQFEEIYGSIPCLDLHSEQIVDETTRHMYSPTDDYARSVYHIAWSQNFANILVDSGVEKEKIYITGSIRNDSIINSRKPLPQSKSILICTSFSNTFVAPAYIDRVLTDHDIEEANYRLKIEITREIRDFYFREIERYARINPDADITIRPHPYVEISDFISAYLTINRVGQLPGNVRVERCGSVQEAINLARYVVCWQSSVLLDSQLMGRSTFLMQNREIPAYMQVSFSNVAANIRSLDELSLASYAGSIPSADIEFIYGSIDGKSSVRVADTIQEILRLSEPSNNFVLSKYLNALFRGVLVDFVIVFLSKLGLSDKVFPLYKGITEDRKFYCYKAKRNYIPGKQVFRMTLGRNGNEFINKEPLR